MGHIVGLQVAFGGKSLPTYVTHERLFPSMSPLVNLKSAHRGEVLPIQCVACCLACQLGWATNKGVMPGDIVTGPTNAPGASTLT